MVVQLNRIGDFILLTPMLIVLKEKYPEADIHFLAGRKNFDVAYNHPLVDKTYRVSSSLVTWTHLPTGG